MSTGVAFDKSVNLLIWTRQIIALIRLLNSQSSYLTYCPGNSTLGRVEKSKNGIKSYGYCFLGGFWYVKTRGKNFGGHRTFFAGWNFTWKSTQFLIFCKIELFLWQSKTMLKYFINLKVMAALERGDQELSIGSLISLITFCLAGWNFTWKRTILSFLPRKFVQNVQNA